MVFDLKKSGAEAHQTLLEAYDDANPSYPNCQFSDFNAKEKKRLGGPKNFSDFA